MKIAIQSPFFLFGNQDTNFNGYNLAFFKLYKPAIYIPGWRKVYIVKLRKRMKELGLDPADFPLLLSAKSLNRKVDMLISFSGLPHLPIFTPPKGFDGLKVFHVMDYVFNAGQAYRSLQQNGVDYVMGYTDHSKYCPFFKKFYPAFEGKVVPVPFGYGNRFQRNILPQDRIKKCIAAGSVNPVDDPAVPDREVLREYVDFYSDETWTHKWRKKIADNVSGLQNVLDSVLPQFPQTKNPSYDSVELFNRYALFVNDEGLMAFPPARTYEATATGCVLVAADHPSYGDLGFRDGTNCIMHEPLDLNDFKSKLTFYLNAPEKLYSIAQAGYEMVTRRYNHEQIAKDLHASLQKLLH